MIKRERLVEHLRLQDELNRCVNPDWVTENFNWTQAIMVEGVELLDHYGWKWWKHQERNIAQVHLELVDIWHFILSDELAACDGDRAEALANLIHGLGPGNDVVPFGYRMADINLSDAYELIHLMVASAAAGFVHLPTFDRLMNEMGLSWEKLDLLYRTKNVLNVFRQKHGYKDGTYVKTWLGKEDNEVIHDLLSARPDATVEQLNAKLESIYIQATQKETA